MADRRHLHLHNSPSASARLTPTKQDIAPAFGGDRFIPMRGLNDDEERATRFAALSPAASGSNIMPRLSPYKSPRDSGKETLSARAGPTPGSPAVRRLFPTPSSVSMGSTSSNTNAISLTSINLPRQNNTESTASPLSAMLPMRRVHSSETPLTGGHLDAGSTVTTAISPRGQQQRTNAQHSTDSSSNEHVVAHHALLANELLGTRIEDIRAETVRQQRLNGASTSRNVLPGVSNVAPSLFQFRTPALRTTPTKENRTTSSRNGSVSEPPKGNTSYATPSTKCARRALNFDAQFAATPLSESSQRMLKSPRKPPRHINKNPYKVLDAPELQDDFYLNLVDWSSTNTLAVGLGHCVYLWSAQNSSVHKLCDLSGENDDSISAVQWNDKGTHLGIGTAKGLLQIWDVSTTTRVHNLQGHQFRVGCVAWGNDVVCTGSRDRTIIQRDLRDPEGSRILLKHHKQEVCGLKWSPDQQLLASGGNDNHLLIWSPQRLSSPVQVYSHHTAAVKALAWCPQQHGLLVSGGGTADRHLRFWNTLTGQSVHAIDTGSQVCNVAWSRHTRELVSTHGYSQNQIIVWQYPSFEQVAKLVGHSSRVLYLATSPDGESIVTGAGDETLRFWHVFAKHQTPRERSALNFFTAIR